MPYSSTITFTLDPICPWTYLAFLRLRRALHTFSTTSPLAPNISFTLRLAPFQLFPDFPSTTTRKYAWYLENRFNGDEHRMATYMAAMNALGDQDGVKFEWEGEMGNTLNAHRVLYVLQERDGDMALDVLAQIYKNYFENGKSPAAEESLVEACVGAGLGEEEARTLVRDEQEGLMETKVKLREQVGNGVDAVPCVVVEGRKRDFEMVGAKGEQEYVKILESAAKEAV